MIHRLWCAHVGDDVLNGDLLIGGFLKRKLRAKGAVLCLFQRVGEAGACFALGVDIEEFGGDIAHPFTGLALGALPLATAKFVQGGSLR